jgi:hypothetical protein
MTMALGSHGGSLAERCWSSSEWAWDSRGGADVGQQSLSALVDRRGVMTQSCGGTWGAPHGSTGATHGANGS